MKRMCLGVALTAALLASQSVAGVSGNGTPSNGLPSNGLPSNGTPSNGVGGGGTSVNGSGVPANGAGATVNGAGVAPNGAGVSGLPGNGPTGFPAGGAPPPRCMNASAVSEIKAVSAQVQQLANQIRLRQSLLASETAERNALLAAIAAAATPQERAQQQSRLARTDAEIAALNSAIASEQSTMAFENAILRRLRSLPPC